MSFFRKSQLSSDSESQKVNSSNQSFTSGFKSVGRTKNASLAYRFARETNDLCYDINFSQIKGKGNLTDTFHHSQLQQRQKNGGQCVKRDNNKFELRQLMISMNKVQNPEKINFVELERYSTFNTQGLCKYEFEKTIAGRLKHRQFSHLYFKNQVSRKLFNSVNNLQSLLYSCSRGKLSKTLNIYNLRNQGRTKGNKCHNFDSYIPHKVFEPRKEVDKFYEIGQCFTKTKPKTIKQTAKISEENRNLIKYRTNINSINNSKIKYKNYRSIDQSSIKSSSEKHKFEIKKINFIV